MNTTEHSAPRGRRQVPLLLVCDNPTAEAVCRAVVAEAGASSVPEAAAALLRNGQALAVTTAYRLTALAEVTR